MQPLIHLAIHLSDKLYNVPSAIHRHIQVSCRHGAVWLPGKVRAPRTIVLCGAGDRCGKPDRGLPRSLVDTLNRQIEAGYPAYLFIIDPDPRNRLMYLSELQAVSLKSPPSGKELV